MPTMRGSSPLARGLHKIQSGGFLGHGIIPARAGFTPYRTSSGGQQWDHPRSRGVYVFSVRTGRCWGGSSPLARGLPSTKWWHVIHGGIIPARAGFTVTGRHRYVCVRDHPRSRGVYETDGHFPASTAGSSPLARGLHRVRGIVAGSLGIIPARAGFTDPFTGEDVSKRDHPRSRGVYVCMMAPAGCPYGSSPLARGLLRVDGWASGP